jgi:hypothetical protein
MLGNKRAMFIWENVNMIHLQQRRFQIPYFTKQVHTLLTAEG